uniref:Uncharacterized protein n=1 Tax=Tanacetum cinerariifolium TaxID=118510 RepID=A0A699GPP0_TANCI|nr:hypothetical protein [Tanacetum cinerariifolium]
MHTLMHIKLSHELGKSDRDQSDRDLVKVTEVSEDELCGQFLSALEKVQYFGTAANGDDEQALQRTKNMFHSAFADMEKSGCKEIDLRSLVDTFKLQEVIIDCQKVITIDPKYIKAYCHLEYIYFAQGKYTESLKKGYGIGENKPRKATHLNPTNQFVRANVRAAEHKVWQQREERGHLCSLIDSDPVQEKQKSIVASVKEHDEARIDLRFKKMKKKMSKSLLISNANRPKIDGDMQYFVDIHDYQRSFRIIYDNVFLELYILPKRENVVGNIISFLVMNLFSVTPTACIGKFIKIISLIILPIFQTILISYVNAAIDTTAIGFKRTSPGCIFTLTACTLGLGPGCIFTLTAIAKWECSSYGRALALHMRGTGFDSRTFLFFLLCG